jgi:predicted ATPase with chaperone activity
VLKVARTIADLDGSPAIRRDDIVDAAGFRALDSEPSRDLRLIAGGATG